MNFIQFDKAFKSWEQFYGFQTKPILITTGKPTSSKLAIYISDCTFANCVSTDSGGVLFYTKTGSLLVEFSTFTECSATNSGGSIYATSCNCIINCICSSKCKVTTNQHGQFLYADVKTDDKPNYVYRSSICSTDDDVGVKYSTIYCSYGKQECESVNISNNYVHSISAFNYLHGSSTNIEYCSFTHNYASGYFSLRFENGNSLGVIHGCNVIDNTQQDNYHGTIYCYMMPAEFTECIILENTPTKLFEAGGTGSSITVSNCVVQSSYTTVGTFNPLSPTDSVDLDFESFIDDCSLLVRERCSTRVCQCLSNIFAFLQNLFVFEVSIPILQF